MTNYRTKNKNDYTVETVSKSNKKNKNDYTVETVSKSNKKTKMTTLLRQFQNPIKKQSKTKIDNPYIGIHDCQMSGLGACALQLNMAGLN